MQIFRFRLSVDNKDDFLRDIEIRSNQTFYDLHTIIVKNLGLDGNELASFHIANDDWEKIQEITLIDMSGEEDKNVKAGDEVRTIFLMNQTPLDKFMDKVEQKLVYEYDFLQMRTFFLELLEIGKKDKEGSYPRIVRKAGTLELKDNISVEKDSEKLKEDLLKEFNSMMKGDFEDDDLSGNDDDY